MAELLLSASTEVPHRADGDKGELPHIQAAKPLPRGTFLGEFDPL
jgi:hypothetical protein